VGDYVVVLAPIAEREWRKLARDIRQRVTRVLLALEGEPRPSGTVKLQASADRWRVRVGDHRVIYRVDDETRTVTVLRIAHRREVYR
jgi:mRNA interferase RelE/StbE